VVALLAALASGPGRERMPRAGSPRTELLEVVDGDTVPVPTPTPTQRQAG